MSEIKTFTDLNRQPMRSVLTAALVDIGQQLRRIGTGASGRGNANPENVITDIGKILAQTTEA